jgi:hypothetical protein
MIPVNSQYVDANIGACPIAEGGLTLTARDYETGAVARSCLPCRLRPGRSNLAEDRIEGGQL